MLNITERDESGIKIFKLEGRVDTEGSVDMDMVLQGALQDDNYKIILDMAELKYLNSSGLRILADILSQCRDNGGGLRLVNMTKKIKRVFQIIGFDRYFTSYESIEAALKDF